VADGSTIANIGREPEWLTLPGRHDRVRDSEFGRPLGERAGRQPHTDLAWELQKRREFFKPFRHIHQEMNDGPTGGLEVRKRGCF